MLETVQTFFQESTDTKVWLTQVFVVVFITVSINFILMRLIDIAEKLVGKTESLWDDALLEAARIPVRLFVWTIGLTFAAAILDNVTETALFGYLPQARSIAYIVILSMFCTRFISYAEVNIVNPQRLAKPMDQTTARALAKLLRMSVMITAGLIILQELGYSVSGVLAFGGVGGIAIGFAAKDMLANFFGGMMIYLDKPFKVGDWVRSPDRQIEGTVEDIGWRLTRIRTFDKRPLYIPNSMFSTIVVENPSRMTNRRIYENLGIRYSDGHLMKVICDDVRDMLNAHPDIDQEQTIIVHFNRYGDSYLEFMLYAFTKTSEWVPFHAVKEDVLLKVMQIVEGHGAEFAFPTRTLHIAADGHPDEAAILQTVTEQKNREERRP
ncbi:mechanosensitive ion channel family protein [Alcanivorax sp. 1008]|uniref:mechanosensitive ion channel family protein n=1 Tax=Alcanivorax sp. 1008 TaxID=2816853 RepID=UPI001D78097A|nr:mechanosensitive ion channel family protein [Alcanivorax sp. 1008]MCC1496275.1 mechanosensitive ion channel family protein [Alcanivorax sp. 1008]